MDKNRRKQLEKLFEAPAPPGKRGFFRKIGLEPASMGNFIRVQFSYVSVWSWGAAILFLGIAVNLSCFYWQGLFSCTVAMMPLLALAGISESTRSFVYGMEELEMSSRFSLKSVLLARMAVVGIEDVLLALVMAWIVGDEYGNMAVQGSYMRTVLYLFVPYLLSVFGSLWIVRSFAGKEGLYACAGLALAVSTAAFASTQNLWWIYQEKYLPAWLAVIAVLGGLAFYEGRKMIKSHYLQSIS
ncbi:hypothetical protein D7V86_08665 [bacterium D16-51]|nr:hypothetical protein D7V96_08680 [bacterium D16-59]RKI60442.1 hypothetical protein D7V86_08665 [bacterium D16-51]